MSKNLEMPHRLLLKAQYAQIFDDLHTGSRISTRQLFDDNCIKISTKYDVKNYEVLITGKQDDTNGLWNIPLKKYQTQLEP